MNDPSEPNPVDTGRRAALIRLGVVAGAAYVAPTLLRLDNSAQAATPPRFCPPNFPAPGCPPRPPRGRG